MVSTNVTDGGARDMHNSVPPKIDLIVITMYKRISTSDILAATFLYRHAGAKV